MIQDAQTQLIDPRGLIINALSVFSYLKHFKRKDNDEHEQIKKCILKAQF